LRDNAAVRLADYLEKVMEEKESVRAFLVGKAEMYALLAALATTVSVVVWLMVELLSATEKLVSCLAA
jgi:hypothetical protein